MLVMFCTQHFPRYAYLLVQPTVVEYFLEHETYGLSDQIL